MVFPSYIFIFVFLPLVLVIWLSKLPFNIRLITLTLASYIFYAWWDYRFVSLLIASTAVDYFCGGAISRSPEGRKKFYLIVSISTNLTFLGFFKYYDFFVTSLVSSFAALGTQINLPLLDIILPLGISFYTFQSISYSIDIYRGDAKPAPDFLHFAAYVALFPQLIAGPIVRYGMMADQLARLRLHQPTLAELSNGLILFVIGLSKKLLIADNVASLADRLFDGTGTIQFATAWAGSLAYTVQLYFDFSGYSDMALGLGLMLGFRFPVNFLSPYKSATIGEFWNRWHITLSHYLRDYLFIPLGGSRGTTAKTARNILVVMFLGGLWHGAAWTYVIWGLYHGVLLTVNAIWQVLIKFRMPRVLGVVVTFLTIHIGWVLFRSPDFTRAKEIYAGMFGFSGIEKGLFAMNISSRTFGQLPMVVDVAGGVRVAPFLLLGLAIAFFAPNSQEIPRTFSISSGIIIGLLFMLSVGSLGKDTPFIYFQF